MTLEKTLHRRLFLRWRAFAERGSGAWGDLAGGSDILPPESSGHGAEYAPAAANAMNPIASLNIVFGVSMFGLAFSGVLTYQELFGNAAVSCPAPGAPGTVFGYPACIYGFFMYLAIATVSALGLRGAKKLD